MTLTRLKKSAAATFALLAVTAAVGIGAPTTANAAAEAPTYWRFMNSKFGTHCLTSGERSSDGTARAFMKWCDSNSWNQQWDWRGNDTTDPRFHQLQNRATGLCLATDAKTDKNSVWLSTCEWRNGMRFRYDFNTDAGTGGTLCANLIRYNQYTCLTTESSGAVYNGTWDGEWEASHD
ncbi:hypothetical protein GCM10027168_35940 [Streptomyces capparidis]